MIQVRKEKETIYLTGLLDSQCLSTLNKQLIELNENNILDLQQVKYIDTNAIWILKHFSHMKNITIQHIPSDYIELWNYVQVNDYTPVTNVQNNTISNEFNYKLNIIIEAITLYIKMFLYKFFGNAAQKKLFWENLIANINEMGLKAIPVFALISFFLGLVITFQGAYQMSMFAAELYVVDFLALSMFRELGPILAGIIFASRSGSAITAQLGTMKNNEEINMLEVMGLDTAKLILLPKVLALMIVSPFMTLFACLMAMFGGLLIFTLYLGYSTQLFFNFFQQSLGNGSVFMFAWKGPLFAFLIGLIACAQGMKVKTSSVDLSKKTTASVVAGLMAVLLMDGIISVLTTFI